MVLGKPGWEKLLLFQPSDSHPEQSGINSGVDVLRVHNQKENVEPGETSFPIDAGGQYSEKEGLPQGYESGDEGLRGGHPMIVYEEDSISE